MENVIPEYMTIREVAKKLRVGSRQVYEWVRTGKLECYRNGPGGSYRFTDEQIKKFLSGDKNE